MASSGPATPASPKVVKVKSPQPGVPLYGCGEFHLNLCLPKMGFSLASTNADSIMSEHVQLFLSSGPGDRLEKTVQHYKDSLRAIFDKDPKEIGAIQTSKGVKGQPLTTITPNYLCLQCTAITTTTGRIEHGGETLHRFCKRAVKTSQKNVC